MNEGSRYGLHGDPIYILYLYDHMWLVGMVFTNIEAISTLVCLLLDDNGFLMCNYYYLQYAAFNLQA